MLLRYAWLSLGLALLAAGLAAGSGPLLALGLLLTLAGFLARVWASRSLTAVTLERFLPERRAFPGEQLRLTYRITNAKLLPVPWIEVSDRFPEPLSLAGQQLRPAGAPHGQQYSHTTRLPWRGRVSWTVLIASGQRGHYRLGPARLRAGDPFGLFSRERQELARDHVVVYPLTIPLPDLGLPSARPLGELKGHQRIFEDPLRIAGVRDHRPGDPVRRIDWKATARRGRLQSRVYEPSATRQLIVALNLDTLEHPWQGYVPELLEGAVIAAASIAFWAHKARYAVGLLANGSVPDSDQPLKIPPGRAPDQLARILEALAGLGPMTVTSLAALLERESHSLPLGSTLAVVTALMPQPLAAVLRRIHASGHAVTVLAMADGDWSELLAAVPCRRFALPVEDPQGVAVAAP